MPEVVDGEEEDSFDSLFAAASQLVPHPVPQVASIIEGGGQGQGQGSRTGSRGGSRAPSGPPSRGSPARKGTMSSLCPANPPSRSHSMRDQTDLMREKFQSKYQQRRMSTKAPAVATNSKPGSRHNSIPAGEDVEVTRQFLATNKKVINRGDSFKRKERPALGQKGERKTQNIQIKLNGTPEPAPEDVGRRQRQRDRTPSKLYRVAFIGCSEVGKTSIMEQFMSSEHADVYDDKELDIQEEEIDSRTITVDVNGTENRLSLIEAEDSDVSLSDILEENNPDCVVIVYAVDDRESYTFAHKSLIWMKRNSQLGRSIILVGNKADLARSRVVETCEGCDLAVEFGVKFTETSPGMGHRIDELLVGIVMQLRLHEDVCLKPEKDSSGGTLMATVKGIFNIFTSREEERRKVARNLNI